LTKALVEKTHEGELPHHLGYLKHSASEGGNARNGKGKNKLVTGHGKLEIDSPRDRKGSFEPELARKHQTRFAGTQQGQIYFTTNELKPDKYLSVKDSAISTFLKKNRTLLTHSSMWDSSVFK